MTSERIDPVNILLGLLRVLLCSGVVTPKVAGIFLFSWESRPTRNLKTRYAPHTEGFPEPVRVS